jgi:vitamin B12 transporter
MSRPLAAVVLATLTVSAAHGQSAPAFQETIVVTAAADEEPVSEANAATTVISRQEIDAAGVAGTSALLRLVPGALLLRSGLDNAVTTFFVRGTNASHTLVLLDGVRLNSPYFGGYDWSVPLTSGIERIEIVRGPYSALYGGDAIGGVVQILPLAARGNSLRLFLEGGGSEWRRAEVEASYSHGGLDLTASAAGRDGSGELDHDDFSTRTAAVDLGWRITPRATARLMARRTSSHTDVPFSGPDLTPNRFTETDESIVQLPLNLDLAVSGRIEASLSWVGRSLAFRDPDEPYGFTTSDTEANSGGVRAVWHGSLGAHRLALGGEWRQDDVTDASSFGTTLDGERIATVSAFFQDRLSLGEKWDVQAGARYDRADPWGDEVSPRVTLARKASRGRLWLSYGHGFRAPALGELYYPFSGNPLLRAERSRCSEVGAMWSLGRAGALQVAAFRNRVEDLIEFDYARSSFDNIGRAAQDGAEVSWNASWAPLGSLTVGLTYLDARDGAGQPLLRRPSWSGSATLQRALAAGVDGRLTLVWVGDRVDVDPISYARTDAAAFLTADLAVTARLSERIEGRLRAENLFDRAYEEVKGYPAPGRRVFVGIETML